MFVKNLKLVATGLLLVLTNRSFSVQDAKTYGFYGLSSSYVKVNNPRKAINTIIVDEIDYLAKLPSDRP